MPAETAPHDACWLAFPHLADEWGRHFEGARAEMASLVRAIAGAGERVELLVNDDETEAAARDAVGDLAGVHLRRERYGDTWTRDTGPVFVVDAEGRVAPVRFGFDGWGGKYVMDGDTDLADRLCADFTPRFAYDFVLEGGAFEVDGEGTCLTTRQCLRSREPDTPESEWERRLAEAVGVERVVWLERGLLNDHTDGHVDTLARFVAPGRVVCMEPTGADDPNAEVLEEIRRDLAAARDARGHAFEVHTMPSPGRILDDRGEPLAASYANFYIANEAVVVPQYDVEHDALALRRLEALFPERRVVGCPARHIVTGGGALHCVTQQQPSPRRERSPS